jgi:hypothetical protein
MRYHELRSKTLRCLNLDRTCRGASRPAQLGAQSYFPTNIVYLSNRKSYLLPGVCERPCPTPANLANLNALNYGGVKGATLCDLKPRTPAIAHDDRTCRFYDFALWNKILGDHCFPRPAQVVLVVTSWLKEDPLGWARSGCRRIRTERHSKRALDLRVVAKDEPPARQAYTERTSLGV